MTVLATRTSPHPTVDPDPLALAADGPRVEGVLLEQVHNRLARLVAGLSGCIPKPDRAAVILTLRTGDPHATFHALCVALTADGVVLPHRHRIELRWLGQTLAPADRRWRQVNFYLPRT